MRLNKTLFLLLLMFGPYYLMADNGYGALAAAILLLIGIIITNVILVVAYLRNGKSGYFNAGLIVAVFVFILGAQQVQANPDAYEPGDSQFIVIPNILILCLLFKKISQKGTHLIWYALVTEFLLLFVFNGTYAIGVDYDDFMQFVSFLVFPCMTYWYTRTKLIHNKDVKLVKLVVILTLLSGLQYFALDAFAWYTDSDLDLFWDNFVANTDDLWKGTLSAMILGSAGAGVAVNSYK